MTRPRIEDFEVPVSASDGDVPTVDSGVLVYAPGVGGSGTDLGWFNVETYGAVHDGSTDDTAEIQATIDAAAAAGGGVVYFPAGVYVVNGALQDTSRSNAQLLLPIIDAVDTEQVSITLQGAFMPPTVVSVIGATTAPDGHSVIKGTLNSGTGSLLGAHGPVGTFDNFTNVSLKMRDLTVRMPSNPVLTALDLSKIATVDLDRVVVDCGSYYVQGLTQPTTTTSVGIRLPSNGNGAHTLLGQVDVVGFYTGFEAGEHTTGQMVTAWGCKVGITFPYADHASRFDRFMAVHCPTPVKVTDDHYFEIDQLNLEHATTGWWAPVYDIDDASNKGHGTVRWHVVLAGTGPVATFTVNGATDIRLVEIGNDATPTTYTDEQAVDAVAGALAAVGASWVYNDPAGTITLTVTASSGTLLMQDGVTAPPVPIETEARDDWLYSD